MNSTFTSTGCLAGAPATTPRRRFARPAGAALISAALFLTAPAVFAQAPSSIAGILLHGTITAGTGGHSSSGTFSQLFTADMDYNVALSGTAPAAPQAYVYATTGADTATVTETTVVVNLTFTDSTSGSFATTFTSGGTQSGTFTVESLAPTPPLVNISTRTLITAGGNAIGGFSIVGDTPRRLLVRVVGPTLGDLGVPNTLANPKLTVFSGSDAVATNDDWDADTNNGDEVRAAQTATGAFALTDASADAAMVVTLDPGLYTVIGEGVAADDEGEILIEAYFIE